MSRHTFTFHLTDGVFAHAVIDWITRHTGEPVTVLYHEGLYHLNVESDDEDVPGGVRCLGEMLAPADPVRSTTVRSTPEEA